MLLPAVDGWPTHNASDNISFYSLFFFIAGIESTRRLTCQHHRTLHCRNAIIIKSAYIDHITVAAQYLSAVDTTAQSGLCVVIIIREKHPPSQQLPLFISNKRKKKLDANSARQPNPTTTTAAPTSPSNSMVWKVGGLDFFVCAARVLVIFCECVNKPPRIVSVYSHLVGGIQFRQPVAWREQAEEGGWRERERYRGGRETFLFMGIFVGEIPIGFANQLQAHPNEKQRNIVDRIVAVTAAYTVGQLTTDLEKCCWINQKVQYFKLRNILAKRSN